MNSEPGGLLKVAWCLRELLTFVKGDVKLIFRDKVFADWAQRFSDYLDYGGAAWANSTLPLPPMKEDRATNTDTPTKPKPSVNSVSTNTDPPPYKSPPRNTYKLPDYTSDPKPGLTCQQSNYTSGPNQDQ
ncbi:hypothetical protein L211DRAFT_850633 [Terfezia boudieri ATCC MYA-4762]|uniref:Uncharacterized protein n=1 Tax=Terfezia boudieri ATCC MYA-4762 TaxID=1051890 RepID=A0A3N4LLT2_9PEZI|nr:hypothetical protein L211DRAFT_850633 [Terfezia boudieri ATCC MYA-4762]